jgi:hypothetical protein
MKETTFTLIVIAWVVSVFAGAPGAAQETSGAPNYLLIAEATVETEVAEQWAAAVAVAARAHAEHPDGALFAAYRRLTGGPDETVRFLFPFDEMAELDAWVPNRRVLFETLGPDRGAQVARTLELAQDGPERILSLSDKLSRPRERVEVPAHLWIVETVVAEGRMTEYAALAQRVKRAFHELGSPPHWLVYGDAIGGDRSKLTHLYGFDEFAELDDWASMKEALSEVLGIEEAARLSAAIESMTRTTTSLWAFEPELSQLSAAE